MAAAPLQTKWKKIEEKMESKYRRAQLHPARVLGFFRPLSTLKAVGLSPVCLPARDLQRAD